MDVDIFCISFQLKVVQQKEEEKKQLLERRAQFKEATKGLLKFSAAEMAAKEKAAVKSKAKVCEICVVLLQDVISVNFLNFYILFLFLFFFTFK